VLSSGVRESKEGSKDRAHAFALRELFDVFGEAFWRMDRNILQLSCKGLLDFFEVNGTRDMVTKGTG
jgi:hypothetical protein